jgi:hypothetical protein
VSGELPIPSTLEGFACLLNSEVARGYFTRKAVANGTTARFFAAYEALTACRHVDAVPVEDLLGEAVAALCPDCDQQLPAAWAPPPAAEIRDFESEHNADHHGHPAAFLIACRLCAEE